MTDWKKIPGSTKQLSRPFHCSEQKLSPPSEQPALEDQETPSFKTTLVLKRLGETSQRKVTGVGLPARNGILFWYGNKNYQTEILLLSTQAIGKGMLRFRHRCPSELSFTGASPQAQPVPLAGRAQQPAAGTVAPREKRWAAPPGMGWDGMEQQHRPGWDGMERWDAARVQAPRQACWASLAGSRYASPAHQHTHTKYTLRADMSRERRKDFHRAYKYHPTSANLFCPVRRVENRVMCCKRVGKFKLVRSVSRSSAWQNPSQRQRDTLGVSFEVSRKWKLSSKREGPSPPSGVCCLQRSPK